MKFLGRTVKSRWTKEEMATKKTPDSQKIVKTPVMPYPSASQSQGFTSYKTVAGTQQLSTTLIDNLYDNTIMNRIINKLAGDCSRMNYSVSYVNIDGTRNEELEQVGLQIDVKLTRRVLRNVFRDMLKYGTAFLYVQYDGELPIRMYTIDPKYLTPILVDGELQGWTYASTGTGVQLSVDEVIVFPNDPPTGEIFGKSIFGPVIQVLELLLNSQSNNAFLIDRFSLPIIQWRLTKKDETVADEKEISQFMNSIFDQLEHGNDVGTDGGVDAVVIGTDSNLIDFVPIVDNLMYTFGTIVGVPLQLIGMPGDNLSVTTRQMASYLEVVRDLQECVADRLVEFLYMPFLATQGFEQLVDYKEVQINFPQQSVEENSKAITWLQPAVNGGYISRKEARNTLGYKGEPIPIDEIEVPQQQIEVNRPGAQKDPGEVKTKTPTEPDPTKRKHE